jgi:hypothetical protein
LAIATRAVAILSHAAVNAGARETPRIAIAPDSKLWIERYVEPARLKLQS